MIKNDDNGIFFSIDAGLALIPIIILLFTIGNINMNNTYSYCENRYFHIAQDSTELMAEYCGHDEVPILEKVSNALSESSDSEKGIETARRILNPFLQKKPWKNELSNCGIKPS